MKKTKAVAVWLKDSEVEDLDRACSEAVARTPGASMSRSAYLRQLLLTALAQKSPDEAP